ncbi:MAG: thiamine-phosphate kinase [Planctomycetaceae bacterium]|jgi:thiamine-monophosphate kinase|nr:thiamine-phosphate kinase [Planctomycetaceae bacterium]
MELEWVQKLRSLPNASYLGDDAAVVGSALLTTDMLTEGVDFLLNEVPPEWIGRKALAVNLSDIAAMGGVPTGFLVAAALPHKIGNTVSGGNLPLLQFAERIYAGMTPLIEKYNLTLFGGDTNTWDGGLVISITMLGKVLPFGVFRRSGGQADDAILTTGQLGGSILHKQFCFEPRINEALYLNEHCTVHSAMDISDGLALDLHRLAAESGLGAVLDEEKIPITDDAFTLSKRTGKTALEHALSDGEDFELLLTVPQVEAEKLLAKQPLRERFGTTLYGIGTLTADKKLRLRNAAGVVRDLPLRGFEH